MTDQNAPISTTGLVNVALGKACRQSSLSQWSMPNDAGRAVDGEAHDYAFHTDLEDSPWWLVDLGAPTPIELIRVFNRESVPGRGASLYVALSPDEASWETVFQNEGGHLGGSREGPLTIELPGRATRYVRVGLRGRDYLHLEQVEVYAKDPASAAMAPAPAGGHGAELDTEIAASAPEEIEPGAVIEHAPAPAVRQEAAIAAEPVVRSPGGAKQPEAAPPSWWERLLEFFGAR